MRYVALAVLLAIPFVAIEAYLRGLETGESRPSPLDPVRLHRALVSATPGSYGSDLYYDDERREVEAIVRAYAAEDFRGD